MNVLVDPDDYDRLKNDDRPHIAWNLFAYVVNGNPAIKPLQVKVTLKEEEQPHETTKNSVNKEWIGGSTERAEITSILHSVDEINVPDGYEKSIEDNTITNRLTKLADPTSPKNPTEPKNQVIKCYLKLA